MATNQRRKEEGVKGLGMIGMIGMLGVLVAVIVACSTSSSDKQSPIPTEEGTTPSPWSENVVAMVTEQALELEPSNQRSVQPNLTSSTPQPTPVPEIIHGYPLFTWDNSPSIDQQILDSDIVVVATFVSATASTETVSSDSGGSPTYLPVQVLRFRASEYLKGTGPTEFVVEVRVQERDYDGHSTEAAALSAANSQISQRNSDYDDRPGVLFLGGPLEAVAPANGAGGTTGGTSRSSSENATKAYSFTSGGLQQPSWKYSIDTLSRAWLPARESTSGQTRSTSNQSQDPEYITDGNVNPPPVIALSDLRTRIREINAMLKASTGVEGYEDCVYGMLVRERYYRD